MHNTSIEVKNHAAYLPFEKHDHPLVIPLGYFVVEVEVPGFQLLVIQRFDVEVASLQLLLKHIDLVHSEQN